MCYENVYVIAKMLVKVFMLCVVCVLASGDAQTNRLTTTQQIAVDGYLSETHHVTTYDGYILEMHRIPYGRQGAGTDDRPVVFLMHGLMSASGAFLRLGPDYSIAYNLADTGFDVWIGNARGNSYSRFHNELDPDDETTKYDFFDFSFEEIGLYDLPAMIDYALDFTDNQRLHYIGHSQGGTAFFVMLSLRSDYNAKIASAHLLAAVGYQEYFPDQNLLTSAANVDAIYNLAVTMGIVELFPEFLDSPTTPEYKMADYCTGNLNQRYMCELFGVRHILRDETTLQYTPAGASLKQAAHYGQNIRDKIFRRYHHGAESNMEVYGLEEPPLYNLGYITADVTLHYSLNDNLLDERDVLAMAADMPNAQVRKVARDNFTHNDYTIALDAKELVTDYIIEALKYTSSLPIIDDEYDSGSGLNIVENNPTTDASTDLTDDPTIIDPEEVVDLDVLEEVTTDDTPGSAASAILNMSLIVFSFVALFI